MNLLIVYMDGTELELKNVRLVNPTGYQQLTTATFGNAAVVHRNVRAFRFEGDWDK